MEARQLDFFALNQLVKAGVDKRLEAFFVQKVEQARAIDPITRHLVEDIERVVRRGGKRLRPTLAMVGYLDRGGKDFEWALDAAVAVEVLHAFMLIHDDIMDQDYVRHGAKNMGGIYRKRLSKEFGADAVDHLADSVSILAGDLVLNWTFEILATSLGSAAILPRLTKHLAEVNFATVAGQQLDVLSSFGKDLTLRQLMKIPHYKTGLYSFVAPLQFGSILAGSDEMAEFREYGVNLGIAFQLIDDDLGMFGSSRQTGKPVQSDLEENKPTLLRYYGHRLASESDQAILKTIFGRAGLTSADVRIARAILVESGARAKVLVTAQGYGDKAKATLVGSGLQSSTVGRLEQLADFCLTRKH